MIILALDCSGKTASIAILQDNALLYESFIANGHTHSETLLPLIDSALKALNLSTADINLYAVCVGPGSFTGLRIGIATIKGLAFVHNTPCAAVSSLEALAACHNGTGTIISALDARRERVYWAAFDLATGTRLSEDTVQSVNNLNVFLENCKKPCFFVGDGATMCYNNHKDIDGVCFTPEVLSVSRAVGVGRIAQRLHANGGTIPPALLQPLYLQPTQAERERKARITENGDKT